MDNFSDIISSVTSRLAQGLGIKSTDRQQLGAWKDKFANDKADNQDRLETLKDEIRQIEARVLHKKTKFEQAHGLVKKMIGQEIELAFRELDRKEKQAAIILRNIDANAIALDKIRELEEAIARGVKVEHLDEIAVKLEEALADVKQTDQAIEDLQAVEYTSPEQPKTDIEGRTAELDGSKEAPTGLTAKTMERLKQLEDEVE